MTTITGERIPKHGVRIVVIWLVLTAIAVPLIMLVLIFQKRIVAGLTAGAVKG